jgi:hypothetical protein
LADHRAEAAVREGQGLDIGAPVKSDRRQRFGMAADEGGRIDIREVDRDDPEALALGALGLGGDDRGGAVAGAQIEDPGRIGEAGEEGAPARRDAIVIIGSARAVEARRDAVVMPVAAPDGIRGYGFRFRSLRPTASIGCEAASAREAVRRG